MVILNPLLLHFATLIRGEQIPSSGLLLLPGANLMMQKQGLAAVRFFPVRTTGNFHLDQAKIDSELDFLFSVPADDLARFDLARFMRPVA